MSLGGRPRKEGGHKAVNLSLNAKTHSALKKIHGKGENRSKFVEDALRPLIRQLDPGPSCKVVGRIDKILKSEICSAVSRKDFEKAHALSMVANSLEPFRDLCNDAGENSVFGFRRCPIEFHNSSK